MREAPAPTDSGIPLRDAAGVAAVETIRAHFPALRRHEEVSPWPILTARAVRRCRRVSSMR